jgi:hypothetical protein
MYYDIMIATKVKCLELQKDVSGLDINLHEDIHVAELSEDLLCINQAS